MEAMRGKHNGQNDFSAALCEALGKRLDAAISEVEVDFNIVMAELPFSLIVYLEYYPHEAQITKHEAPRVGYRVRAKFRLQEPPYFLDPDLTATVEVQHGEKRSFDEGD